jgi:hypothetical protein
VARHSNNSVAEILSPLTNVSLLGEKYDDKYLALSDRKITMATEGFTTDRFCELILKDRSRLSKEMP